jgi:hypothetical protein
MPTPTEPQALTLPKIGDYWPGQGGVYCGIARGEDGQPDYHLILAEANPSKNLTWQAAKDFAHAVEADGHTDFSLPTRFESALLYANVKDQIAKGDWYWTGTAFGGASAWSQYFYLGYQLSNSQSRELRARAVRRLILEFFNEPVEGSV